MHPTSRKDLLLCHKTKGACVIPFSARMNPSAQNPAPPPRGRQWDLIMKIYTSLGNGGAIGIAASVLMLFRERTYAAGMCSGIALIFSVVITNLMLKPFFARPRHVTMDDYIPR